MKDLSSFTFLVSDVILANLFLFNFKTTYCKNHFDTNLVKSIKRLLRNCHFFCAILVTANGGHLGIQEHSGTKFDEFQPMFFLDIVIFMFMLFSIKATGRHLDRYIFIQFWNNLMQESFSLKFGQNLLSGYYDIVIFTFCAIFSNGK